MYDVKKDTVSGLTEHFNIDELSKLLIELHALIDMRVSINNCAGERLAASAHSLNPYCLEKYENPGTNHYCRMCTMAGGERAGRLKAPFLYRCYAGFAAVAIPVFAEDRLVAVMITSGFRIEPELMDTLEQILFVEGQEYAPEVLAQSPEIHHKRIMDIASILSLAAKYISEAGLRSSIQSQLHDKSLELMAQMQIRAKTEKLLSQAQFKALQSQINPHFLFNTLNAISQLAILERADRSAEAIFSLSSLLRRSLSQNSGMVFLREEVEYIEEYFKIKKMMYRDRITFVLEIDESCLYIKVPVFTIQPLVENALLHGLEPRENGGCLKLSISRMDKSVVILIEDDGLGFSRKKLADIKSLKVTSSVSDTTGIGISNVILRLKDCFGINFHWHIDSLPGIGTRIELSLPEARGG